VVLHVAEVVVRKLLLFFGVVSADVTGIAEHFCDDGVYFHWDLAVSEDLSACF
jgi:hypothetical protein